MSLFKKTKWHAYAASSPLVDEEHMPGTIVGQIVNGVMNNDRLGERVAGATLIDLVSQARAATFYARAHYIHGTPTGNLKFYEFDHTIIENVIKSNLPVGATDINWFHATPDDDSYYKFMAEWHLKNNWFNPKFQSWKNGLPKPRTAWDVGLNHVVIPVWDSATGAYKNIANKYTITSAVAEEVRLTFTDGSNHYKVPVFNVTLYIEAFCVRYKMPGDTTTQYWLYAPETGTVPELEGNYTGIQTGNDFYNEFLPVAILIHDREDFNADPDSEWHTTTNRLLKKLNMNGDVILEQLHEQEFKKVQLWDAYIHFGVPIRTKQEGSKRYLFHFFEMLSKYTAHTPEDFKKFIAVRGDGANQPFTDLTITEGGGGGYHAEYRWTFIDSVPVDPAHEPIPDIGKTTMTFHERPNNGPAWEAELQKYYPGMTQFKRRRKTNEHDFIVITHHSYTGTVTRLVVMGINMRYMVNTKEYDGSGSARNRFFEATMFGDEEEVGEFTIPVNIGLMSHMPPIEAETMIADSMHCTLFLVQKVTSYRGWFKWLVMIIIIVIIVLTWQYQFLPALAAAVAGSSAVLFYAAYIIITFMYSILLSTAMAIVDNEIFGYIVLAVSLYLSAGGLQGIKEGLKASMSSVKTAWSNMITAPGIGSALNFVQSVSSYLNIGWSVYERRALSSLERDFERLEQDYKDELEAIEAAYAGLSDAPSWLDPLDLVMRPNGLGMYELPDTFFNRMLNTNPGVIGLQFPNIFYDRALDLPDLPGEGSTTMDQFFDMQAMRGA